MAGFSIVDLYNNKRKVSSIAAATLNRNKSDNSGDNIHEKTTMTTTATATTAAVVSNSPLRASSHSSAVTVAVDTRKSNSNDRQQQNHPSDSASVASTVKISNVAGATLSTSPSKGNSIPPTSTSQQTRFLPVGLISVIQSQPKHSKATSSPTTVLPVPVINEQHDLLSAPTTSSTTTEATTIQAESFLLCTLERISPNKYLCIVTDRNFISPTLQKQLLNSDRSQPIMTPSGLRSIWNHLSVHDYQCISNSVLHHMRIVERQRSPFLDMKKQWRLMWNGCTRSTSADPATSSSASSSAASSSVPPSSKATVTMLQEDPSNHRGRQQQDIDESSCVSESHAHRQHLELLQTVPLGVPTLSSLSMSSSASGSNADGSAQQHQLMSNKNNPLLQQPQQPQPNQQSPLLSQEDDPMHLLNEILDSASDSSYSFGGGYTTTTSMTSNSVDSHHQYNMANRSTNPNIKNGNSNRRPPQNRMSYKRNNGSTTSSITSASSSTYNNNSNTTPSSKQQYNRNTTTSANQQHQHQHHSDPNDNDSTTSSSYLSIASGASTNSNTNDHISISGSVASV